MSSSSVSFLTSIRRPFSSRVGLLSLLLLLLNHRGLMVLALHEHHCVPPPVSVLNRTWRQLAEDSDVWGLLYNRKWSSPFPLHGIIPSSIDMGVDDYRAPHALLPISPS